ncbi:MAG: hypothetical protein QOG67_18 [Verrucomicrobiota bacterium]|jgi:hypothetical protein
MPEDHSFVPKPWSGTDEPAREWLYNTGSLEQALAYGELFWPHFVEHDDCVFLSLDLEKYKSWMTTLEGSKARVEAVLNHRHIADLFENTELASHDWLINLGRKLKQCWAAKLQLDFPERHFEVQFEERRSPAATDYEITFFQSR